MADDEQELSAFASIQAASSALSPNEYAIRGIGRSVAHESLALRQYPVELGPLERLAIKYINTTKPAAGLLPGRATFVERVRAELLERREPADVEELMRGLT